mmetsp:Transcript_13834/g.18062  ORF Transcript_13834/g.18062 Transcript_13834/m.18062 type:complete len:574 (+) Transcript_13834:323-2044(+)
MAMREYNPFARMDNISKQDKENDQEISAAEEKISSGDVEAKSESMKVDTDESNGKDPSLNDDGNAVEATKRTPPPIPPKKFPNEISVKAHTEMKKPPPVPPKKFASVDKSSQMNSNIIVTDAKISGTGVKVSEGLIPMAKESEGFGEIDLSGNDNVSANTLNSEDEDVSSGEMKNNSKAFWDEQEEWKLNVLSRVVNVSISDPVQADRSFTNPNPPVMYLVSTDPTGTKVRRRYSDFDWLRELLQTRYVGIMVPPLPEKKIGSSKAFIQSRMRGLNLFMNRLLENPYLKSDSATKLFLEAEALADWEQGKKAEGITNGSQRNEGQTRWMQALTNYTLPKEADSLVLDITKQVDSLEGVMKTLLSSCAALVANAFTYSSSLQEFTAKYQDVVRSEETAVNHSLEHSNVSGNQLVKVLQSMGGTFTRWSELQGEEPKILERLLQEILKYEHACVLKLKELLKLRKEIIRCHEKALETKIKRDREKTTLENSGRMDKVKKLEAKLQEDRERVQITYDHALFMTKGLFFSEIDRFAARKVQGLNEMMGSLSSAFDAHTKQMQEMWAGSMQLLHTRRT